LRTALASGLAATPQQRPDLARILDALEGKAPPAKKWLLAGAAAATLATVGMVGAFAIGDDEPVCDVGASWLDPARRFRLHGIEATTQDAAGLVSAIEERERAVSQQLAAVCSALHAGKLTEQQAQMRQSCLQRRIFELDATVAGVLAARTNMIDRVTHIDDGETCIELVAHALPADPSAAAALWARLVRAEELAIPTMTKPHEQALASLEAEARAAGEHELAVRAALNLGRELLFQDRLDVADAAFQRAYRGAVEIKAVPYAVLALLERSRVATLRNDGAGAVNFAELASDLANTMTASPARRAQIDLALGDAASSKGDYKTAVQRFKHGIDTLAAHTGTARDIELDLRVHMVAAFAAIEGAGPKAVEAAQQAVARAKLLYGERTTEYALALNSLAFSHRTNSDLAAALPVRKQALELYQQLLPAAHSSVVFQHLDYAADLLASGEADEAIGHYERAFEHTKTNQRVRAQRATIVAMLATTTFELGRHDEGLARARDAVEIAVTDLGAEHPSTQEVQGILLDLALERDSLDEVDRTLASMERVWVAKPDDYKRRAPFNRGTYQAEAAIRRGKPKQAEQLTRTALATLIEIKATPAELWPLHRVLGESLLAQHRFADAQAEFTTALDWARQAKPREDQYALLELGIARAELGQGKRDAAIEHAQRAREVLAKYPSQIIGRRNADQLLR
jgi:tetratricopeptide (TPR) repeat protein